MNPLELLAADLARVFLRIHRLMDRRMTAEGASLAQTKLLMCLDQQEGMTRAADIAGFLGLAPRTVTEAIDGLERDGLLRREPDPCDRRAKRLSITDAGRTAIAATEPLRVELVDQIFGGLDPEERVRLGTILAKLMAAIDDQEAKAG